jgi:hypothetical protein
MAAPGLRSGSRILACRPLGLGIGQTKLFGVLFTLRVLASGFSPSSSGQDVEHGLASQELLGAQPIPGPLSKRITLAVG